MFISYFLVLAVDIVVTIQVVKLSKQGGKVRSAPNTRSTGICCIRNIFSKSTTYFYNFKKVPLFICINESSLMNNNFFFYNISIPFRVTTTYCKMCQVKTHIYLPDHVRQFKNTLS